MVSWYLKLLYKNPASGIGSWGLGAGDFGGSWGSGTKGSGKLGAFGDLRALTTCVRQVRKPETQVLGAVEG